MLTTVPITLFLLMFKVCNNAEMRCYSDYVVVQFFYASCVLMGESYGGL